jgi:hypothetical protein
MSEFKKPRFVFAAFFSVVTTIAYLLTDKMDGNQYITVMTIVLGLYSATVITAKIKGK